MISIKDLLSSFKLKSSPERELISILKEFFKQKGANIPNIIITVKGKTIKVMGDPYVSYYIKTNNEEILSYVKSKTSFSLERIE